MSQDYTLQSMRALQLAGMSERTQQAYTRSVRLLVDFYGKAPDEITEPELEDCFLRRRNVDKWSSATLRIAVSGVKFFFEKVLQREWHIFTYLRSQKELRLPSILSREQVFRVLKHIKTFQNFACLSIIYACGLRISEALGLEVSDIDGKRMMVHVHRGKGAKDRTVPLPERNKPGCDTKQGVSSADWVRTTNSLARPRPRHSPLYHLSSSGVPSSRHER